MSGPRPRRGHPDRIGYAQAWSTPRTPRPGFDDFSRALTPAKAAAPVVDLVLAPLEPSIYGELVRFGKVLPWLS